MPFLRIEFNLEALRKLAERRISVDEVSEVFQTTSVVWIENPNPRTDDSRWLIGPTRAGRFLTVVVDRDSTDHGRVACDDRVGLDRSADPRLQKSTMIRQNWSRHV